MKLELGRSYRSRRFEKVTIISEVIECDQYITVKKLKGYDHFDPSFDPHFKFHGIVNNDFIRSYHEDGVFANKIPDYDIVDVWPEKEFVVGKYYETNSGDKIRLMSRFVNSDNEIELKWENSTCILCTSNEGSNIVKRGEVK